MKYDKSENKKRIDAINNPEAIQLFFRNLQISFRERLTLNNEDALK